MPIPPFVLYPERPGESICTKCFLTVRASKIETLQEAQAKHTCTHIDLKAVGSQRLSEERVVDAKKDPPSVVGQYPIPIFGRRSMKSRACGLPACL